MNEDNSNLGRIVDVIEHAPVIAGGDLAISDARETGQEGVESIPNDGEAPPNEPRALGFDVDDMNREYALVLMGSKSVIFLEQPTAPIEDQQRVLVLDAFKAWFANRFTEVLAADGKIKRITWATAWLQHRQRRSYRGIEFHPDPENRGGTPNYLNLWGGFSVRPAKKKNGWSILRDHMFNNVCQGDEALYEWLFGFFAHMIQRPRERLGVAVVMRGEMGAGKTVVGEVMGSLIQRHYFLVDDPRYVTGQFNAHMATCLLLQADEAVWAGDKAAEGRLKGLVTSPVQQIEAKGVDPIRLKNYVRLIMTSNEDWVVPAGKDERRFCVLDVDPRCAQNHDYFREMNEQLDKGGRAALLADLLDFDLESVNLRKIPRTSALLEQKLRSLDSVEAWWHERLQDGTTTRGGEEWLEEIPKETLVDDYVAMAERVGVKRKAEETVIGMKLSKLVPGLRTVRRFVDQQGTVKRRWCYLIPALDECRGAFEAAMQQTVSWQVDDA